MKLKSLALILASALSVNAAGPALAEVKATPPDKVIVGGTKEVDAYGIVKKLVIDIDETLKQQGIDPKFCTFRQTEPKQDFSYRGVGTCLYHNFIKSMKTDRMAGTVYTWIQDRQGRYHPIEIQWRPPHSGWLKLIRQLVEMRLEVPLYKIRETVRGPEWADKLRYKEFLGGELKVILPEDPAALEVLAANGGEWAKKYLEKIKSVDFRLDVTGIEKGKVIYDGGLQLNFSPKEDGAADGVKVILHTDINVLLLKQPKWEKEVFGARGNNTSGKIRAIGDREAPISDFNPETLP